MNTTTATNDLSGFIPDIGYYREYISRDLANGIKDLDVLASAHRLHKNVLFEGPTGSSKTSIVYAYAAMRGLPLINIACDGGVDTRTLIGGWNPKPDGTWDFAPGHLVQGAMDGAVILFDEINFLPAKMASVAYSLLDKRRTVYLAEAVGSTFPSVFKAHKDTFILAGCNPGYIGTRPLNQALRNRFSIQLEWGYDEKVESQLVVSNSLADMAKKLRQRTEVGDLNTPIPTNALMEFEEFAQEPELGMDFATDNFVSRFIKDEQKVVREVVSLHRMSIAAELGLISDDEEVSA